MSKRIDFHTHTFLSDGMLIPSELIRQAEVKGYKAIGLTDHVDASNMEETITKTLNLLKKQTFPITVIPGVELSYVPPQDIPAMAKEAKKLGAKLVIVHGETAAFDEPVYPGTNKVAVELKGIVDILAHPGLITEEEAALAAQNGVYLELSARKTHALGNQHVAKIARAAGAKLLLNTDTHRPDDLLDLPGALQKLTELKFSDIEANQIAVINAEELLKRIG